MKARESFGLLLVLSMLVFARGAHWFITPQPGASTLRAWAVAAQVIVALGFAVFSYRKMRQLSGTSR
jgi:hypothetical protein